MQILKCSRAAAIAAAKFALGKKTLREMSQQRQQQRQGGGRAKDINCERWCTEDFNTLAHKEKLRCSLD